jgi:3-oxoacyl-[acyl-carrier-protein] synthase-1
MNTWLGRPGLLCALGTGAEAVRAALFAGDTRGMQAQEGWLSERALMVGAVDTGLPPLPAGTPVHHESRNNRLLQAAALQIGDQIEHVRERYGAHRIAIVLGTSTSGVNDNTAAFVHREKTGDWPADYDYRRQSLYAPSSFLAQRLALCGPAYTLSTACTSSARALLSARRMLKLGVCDAVICGGADTLCRLTINGFHSLQALAPGRCNPFSARRDGINIGEAAALFVMTREAPDGAGIALLGAGASSDAWHMSAPDPTGAGALAAMRAALHDAGRTPADIGWLNLHGTATIHNDAMESLAVAACFPDGVPCASTKPLTGHTLGAAGALEAALCWIALAAPAGTDILPPHVWDGYADPALPALDFSGTGQCWPAGRPRLAMSNSFAFGGNNACLVLGAGA